MKFHEYAALGLVLFSMALGMACIFAVLFKQTEPSKSKNEH